MLHTQRSRHGGWGGKGTTHPCSTSISSSIAGPILPTAKSRLVFLNESEDGTCFPKSISQDSISKVIILIHILLRAIPFSAPSFAQSRALGDSNVEMAKPSFTNVHKIWH